MCLMLLVGRMDRGVSAFVSCVSFWSKSDVIFVVEIEWLVNEDLVLGKVGLLCVLDVCEMGLVFYVIFVVKS